MFFYCCSHILYYVKCHIFSTVEFFLWIWKRTILICIKLKNIILLKFNIYGLYIVSNMTCIYVSTQTPHSSEKNMAQLAYPHFQFYEESVWSVRYVRLIVVFNFYNSLQFGSNNVHKNFRIEPNHSYALF